MTSKTVKNICYTGIGARKNGRHTQKQFMNVMDKNFMKDCPMYIESLTCDSCKKSTKMTRKYVKNLMKKKKVNLKSLSELKQIIDMCTKCKTKRKSNCNFDEYIEFSGAIIKPTCKDLC